MSYNAMLRAGLDAGDDRPGLRVRLVDGLLRRHRPAARGLPAADRAATAARSGCSTADGLNIRVVALVAAGVVRRVRDPAAGRGAGAAARGPRRRRGSASSAPTASSSHDLRDLYRAGPHTVYFLGASALFRDGLAAVFTFGAVLAVTVYGIDTGDVLIFGVAANVVSAAGRAGRRGGSRTGSARRR